MKKLVLASSSPQRKFLMERLQIPFHIDSPNIDESPLPNEPAQMLVERLAIEKAKAVANKYPDAVIIGSDQVGTLNDIILGKPHTHENAIKQLLLASGEQIDFYTGLCVYDVAKQQQTSHIEKFSVKFRQLNQVQIENYLMKEKPYQCAGSGMALVL